MEPEIIRLPGRPKLGTDKRSKVAQICLTPKEYKFLSVEAEKRKCSVAEVIRDTLSSILYEQSELPLEGTMLVRFRRRHRRITKQEARDLIVEIINKL